MSDRWRGLTPGRRLHQAHRRGEAEDISQTDFLLLRHYRMAIRSRWHRRIGCCQDCPPRDVHCIGCGVFCQAWVIAFQILEEWGLSYVKK